MYAKDHLVSTVKSQTVGGMYSADLSSSKQGPMFRDSWPKSHPLEPRTPVYHIISEYPPPPPPRFVPPGDAPIVLFCTKHEAVTRPIAASKIYLVNPFCIILHCTGMSKLVFMQLVPQVLYKLNKLIFLGMEFKKSSKIINIFISLC